MARLDHNTQEARLLELLNSSANRNKCGECKSNNPTWASWNLGVFLCGRCASAHRSLGPEISRVKSLSMEKWSKHEILTLSEIGNKANNKFWNEKQVPFLYDPDDKDALIMWLRDKYTGRYRYGAVHDSDYRLDDDWADTTDDFGYDKPSSSKSMGRRFDERFGKGSGVTRSMRKSYAQSNGSYDDDYDDYNSRRSRPSMSANSSRSRFSASPVASPSRPTPARAVRLTYRKITSSERTRYGDQSRKMKYDLGYEDEDINIEALALANGNIDQAVWIIKNSGAAPKPKKAEVSKPQLPMRKNETGAIFDSSKAGGFNWLEGDTQQNNTAVIDGKENQIYQYVDPMTGAIYYIDGNGQQYADPSQPQQQMMNPYQLQQAQQMLQQQSMQPQNTMYTGTTTGLMQQQQQQPMYTQQTGFLPQTASSQPSGFQMQNGAFSSQTANFPQQTDVFGASAPASQTDLTLNQIQMQRQQQQQQQQMQMQMQMQQMQQMQQPQFYGQPF